MQLVVTVKVLLVKFVSTSRRGEILQSLALQFIAEMRENVFDELQKRNDAPAVLAQQLKEITMRGGPKIKARLS
jgi:ABC-type transport system involved in cytochrome bd biosynthesis fused ATPase/permease subunit